MTNVLIIVNDALYGSERAYNAIRLAVPVGKRALGSLAGFAVLGSPLRQ